MTIHPPSPINSLFGTERPRQDGVCESCSFLKELQIAAGLVVKGYPDDCRTEINDQFSKCAGLSAASLGRRGLRSLGDSCGEGDLPPVAFDEDFGFRPDGEFGDAAPDIPQFEDGTASDFSDDVTRLESRGFRRGACDNVRDDGTARVGGSELCGERGCEVLEDDTEVTADGAACGEDAFEGATGGV